MTEINLGSFYEFNNKREEELRQTTQEFMEKIKSFSPKDKEKILSAYNLAKEKHKNQIHGADQPYIIHLLETAIILLDVEVDDPDLISAALLHDIVEDTPVTIKEMQEKFGSRVAQLVKDLTRERDPDESEQDKLTSKPRHFSEIMKKPKEIQLIKAADLLAQIAFWPKIPKTDPKAKKFPRWQKEAHELYLPLAKSTDKRIYIMMKQELAKFEIYLKS